MHALQCAGVLDAVQPLLLRLSGRCVHGMDGQTQFLTYGQRADEVIYSVSRPGLNAVLLDHAEALPGVTLEFEIDCVAVDLAQRRLQLQQESQAQITSYQQLIAADGYASVARAALLQATQGHSSNEVLAHGYKELTLPAGTQGQHQLDPQALPIWPRGEFMLIALPTLDGSFTVTLFLPFETSAVCAHSFAQLHDATSIENFFASYFPDALVLMPGLAVEFMAHPTGRMSTVRSSRWTDNQSLVLIGDAAHAIVPFHGQGMNCAFEDCAELDTLLQQYPFAAACERFEQQRRPNANAIADMALENYLEMRDSVRHPQFLLHKQLAFELERQMPAHFIPRYSMVMFHHEIPYADAYARGIIQNQLLEELTLHATQMDEIDMALAVRLVHERLSAFPATRQR